ncbi:kinase-like domain-containing protein [Pilaira anomala]|nr:kinase-like domain-containing protein [Pilaira anomala]
MSTSNCPESDSWKTEEPQRRPSINLLDMNQVLSVQPNSQQPEQQLKKLLYNSLQKFDPLQSREPTKPDPELKLTPTRLPRRPALSSHVSAERLITVDPDITPPSSPSRRVRQTSIARLAKPSTSLGKANRELAEFDPLISPVKEKRLSSSANKDHSKKGVQTEASIKSQEKTCTRIPLPNRQQTTNEKPIIIPEKSITDHHQNTSKLRKPEVIVPKALKRNSSQPKREMSVNYSRRPSFPTAANEILQEQWDKEREKSRALSVNLISAQGLISQPDDIDENHNESTTLPALSRSNSNAARLEKIHDRLQCLVDTGQEEHHSIEYKREQGNTEVLSPKTALNRYRPFLSPYEKTEILRYPSIYCVGSHAKKHWASTDQTALNYGYDDEKGDYQIVLKDHLNYRYEIVDSLGKGSFGQVVKCKDHKPPAPSAPSNDPASNNLVAIKIIRNKKRFHAQALTEVKILEQLIAWDPQNKHYNVRMLNSFYFRDHLCIVFECLSLNLYEILQQNSYQGFSMGLVKRFAYQILTSLKLLSDHNIIHCDLKPENILLRQPDRSGIRVIDYGSSCYVNEKVYTYIQSRFYRAPEVILGLEYGLPIDMWSTGCILAELYTGRPLFPGENEPDQLACIMQLLGVPSKEYLDRCSRKKQFFDMYDQPRKSINSKGKKRRPNSLTFTEALKRSTYDNFDRDFGDFISRCLTWEPEKRLKPVEALNHPWVQAMKK